MHSKIDVPKKSKRLIIRNGRSIFIIYTYLVSNDVTLFYKIDQI